MVFPEYSGCHQLNFQSVSEFIWQRQQFFNAAKTQLKKEGSRRKIKTHKITNFLVKIICSSYNYNCV